VVMTPMGKEGKDGMSMTATIKTYNEGETAQAAGGPAAKKRRGQ